MKVAKKKRFITNRTMIAELRQLAAAHGGMLLPEVVVEAARDEGSSLHSSFPWDDTTAAHAWRMHLARNLIRVTITYVGEDRVPCRVFVSLTTDREEGGGYRTMAKVMGDDAQRAQLLQDALEEMRRFEVKYAALRELSGVFAAMRKARKSRAKK